MLYGFIIVIAFIIALFVVLGMKSALKTARFDRYMTAYVDEGTFEITASNDVYIRTETKTERIRNDTDDN